MTEWDVNRLNSRSLEEVGRSTLLEAILDGWTGMLLAGAAALFMLWVNGYTLVPLDFGLDAASQATINDVPPGRQIAGAVGTLRGVELRSVDLQGAAVPTGIAGEMQVRGSDGMVGSLDDPRATAGALPDGWLHTGDTGVLDETGVVRIVGRKADFINGGGDKIALCPIEELLLRHRAILDVRVPATPHAISDEDIMAFVVAHEPAALDVHEPRAIAHSLLPAYPSHRARAVAETIPRNAAGKVSCTQLKQVSR